MGVIPIFEAILNNFTKRGHFSFGLLFIKSGPPSSSGAPGQYQIRLVDFGTFIQNSWNFSCSRLILD